MQKDEAVLTSLSQRMNAMSVSAEKARPGKLQGVPTPQGKHLRFSVGGTAREAPRPDDVYGSENGENRELAAQ